ncbi:MAG: phosphatidylserine decarboxylase family protein [Desulfurellaceae bacterium]|nr:phosphatidylserine decarboxylase family protein [Desulfurellaceae bacterium]
MHFAREGYPWIFGLGSLSLVLGLLGFHSSGGILLGLTLFVAFFFRDPDREVPGDTDVIISPADGRVITVEPLARGKYASEQPASRVGIFLSPLNVHVNRVPVTGQVTQIQYQPGKFRAAFAADAAEVNEQNAVSIQDTYGRRVVLVQIAGMLARRIVCRLTGGEQVQQGDRYGMIMLGSRVDVYCPAEVQLKITVGQRVKAGETVIGEYRTRAKT